jgi:triacylglycerol lipase
MGRAGRTWVLSHILLPACLPAAPELTAPELDASTEPASFDSLADAGDADRVDLEPDAALSPPEPVLQKVALFPASEVATDCANRELDFDFSPAGQAFSIDAAFWAMWFAERAMFHDDPLTARELQNLGFTRYQIVKADAQGMQAFVAARPDVVVVAFRGSDELIDWIGDFNFPLNEGAAHGVPGKVHRGFAEALEASWPALERLVVASVDRGQPVWVTGHSLGGAEATLTAVRLAQLGLALGPLYTFGAPRAGNGDFARAADLLLERAIYRVVNESDLVPRLPPTAAAADGASPIVPFAGGLAAIWLRDLDYLHPGQMWWFAEPDAGGLTMFASLDDGQDVPFWAENGREGAVGLIARSGDQGKRHAPTRYLCRLLALREN